MEEACAAVVADAGLHSVNRFRIALVDARRRLQEGGDERDCRVLTDLEMHRCIDEALDALRDEAAGS